MLGIKMFKYFTIFFEFLNNFVYFSWWSKNGQMHIWEYFERNKQSENICEVSENHNCL